MSNANLVAGVYEAFGRGDLPTVLAALHSQVRWHEAEGSPYQPAGDGWIGPDAVVSNLFERMGKDWASFTVRPMRFHDAGAVVTVEGRYAAEHATSGKSLDCQFCHIWTFEDGKITKFQQYVDTARLQEAMAAG